MNGFMRVSSAVVLLSLASASWAEDFSVHLDNMAQVDAKRAMPNYKFEKVLVEARESAADRTMPKTYDVFMQFKDFGKVRLDEAIEGWPPDGKTCSGLHDFNDIKTGWIKDSPDLFMVAWLNEVYNNTISLHNYVILRLADGKATPLIRGSDATATRTYEGSYDYAGEGWHYSYDAKAGILIEEIDRVSCIDSTTDISEIGISHREKGDGGKDIFLAHVKDKIVIRHRYADGKLTVADCTLTYTSQKDDELTGIARFYLGPLAIRDALLDANPELAAKNKGKHWTEAIYLPAGVEVRIPVPQKWLMERFNREVEAAVPKAPATK